MYRLLYCLSLAALLSACSTETQETGDLNSKLQEGDIIFQSSLTPQSQAVKQATNSQYSHVGILFNENNEWIVYEAVQPVKKTPIDEWIERGENAHYVVKRLKNADDVLNDDIIAKMKAAGEDDMGKDYDIYFNWSDDEIYCSELVWKVYKEGADIQISKKKQLKDFDLTSEAVHKVMDERYGDDVPLEETVVAPADLFASEKLVLVDQN